MHTRYKLALTLTAVALSHVATSAVRAQDAAPMDVVATPASAPDVVVIAVPVAVPVPVTVPPIVPPASITCAEEVHVRASAAVVRVQSGTAVGSGFLVVDGSHVVTSFHTVRDGHDVRVVDHEGNTRSARVVVTAPDDDLALLLLATPLSAEPLAIAEPSSVHVGMHIVALGHPWIRTRDRISLGLRGDGLFEQTLSEGIVSAMGPRALQSDVQLAEGSVGGPMVNCEAHVVGAVSLAHVGMAAPIFVAASALAVSDLVSRAAHEEGYDGRITPYFGLGLAVAFEDPGTPFGLYGLVGLNVLDSFVIAGRFHYLMQDDSPSGTDVLSVGQRRFRGDAYVG